MFAFPRILAIFTTRRCTAACDHCSVGSSPTAKSAISAARIHALIDEARAVSSLRRIVFTGGECFLFGKELDAFVRRAHGAGFETRAITNGYWAVNPRAARARMESLRAAGLDELMISTGSFHARFVPLPRVLHAARAAAAAGIPSRIAIETCDQSEIDVASIVGELAEPIAARMITLSHDPWIDDAGGRGQERLTHDGLRAAGRARYTGGCESVLTVVSVTADMDLIACCGFPLEQLPELRLGSVADTTLAAALNEAPNRLVPMWLALDGPAGIADFVASREPGWRLRRDPVSICDACALLQLDRTAMSVIARDAEQIAASVTTRFISAQGASAMPAYAAPPS